MQNRRARRKTLSFIAEAMWLMKRNNHSSAAKLLESHANDSDIRPDAKIGLFAWIADCYTRVQDHRQAAKWFELAGKAALDASQLMPWEKRRRAISEFDEALRHYEAIDDIQGMSRVAAIRYSLAMN